MEEKTVSIWKTTFIPAVYLGIVLILISVIFYVTGNIFSQWASYLTYPVIVAGIVFGQIAHKKANGGFLSYGQAVGSGIVTFLYATIFTSIYSYLLFEIIDPTLLDQFKIFIEERIVRQGNVPEEQIDTIVNFTVKLQTPPLSIVTAIFSGAFVGLIVSLITGIFVKNNPVDDFTE